MSYHAQTLAREEYENHCCAVNIKGTFRSETELIHSRHLPEKLRDLDGTVSLKATYSILASVWCIRGIGPQSSPLDRFIRLFWRLDVL